MKMPSNSYLTFLTRLCVSVLQDDGILKAQLEASIKRIVFDAEVIELHGGEQPQEPKSTEQPP